MNQHPNLDIVDFFYENRSSYQFPNWTWDQIAATLLKYFQFNQVRVIIENDTVVGALVFEEVNAITLHIIYIATDRNRETMDKFLYQLKEEYPYVLYLTSIRKGGKRTFRFSVNRLNRFYSLVPNIYNN